MKTVLGLLMLAGIVYTGFGTLNNLWHNRRKALLCAVGFAVLAYIVSKWGPWLQS